MRGLAVLAAALAVPGGASHEAPSHPTAGDGQGQVVRMQGRVFAPRALTALIGEQVTWDNDDAVDHTVSGGEELESVRMEPGARFSHAFTRPGAYVYRCRLHPFMFGTVDVYALALERPQASRPPGTRTVLSGRAPAGAAGVELEQQGADGHFRPVAGVAPTADGSFRFMVAPAVSARFRPGRASCSAPPSTCS